MHEIPHYALKLCHITLLSKNDIVQALKHTVRHRAKEFIHIQTVIRFYKKYRSNETKPRSIRFHFHFTTSLKTYKRNRTATSQSRNKVTE